MGGHLCVRVDILADLMARTGGVAERLDVVPSEDILALRTPDPTDPAESGTLVVVASSRVRDLLTHPRVLLIREWCENGTQLPDEEWRILVDDLDTTQGTLTCTLVHPWLDVVSLGTVRALSAGGLPVWTYTATLSLAAVWTAWVAPFLAARGYGFWTLGAVPTTEPRQVAFDRQHAGQVVAQLAELHIREWRPRRASATSWVLDFPVRIGDDVSRPPPRLDTRGAVRELRRTRDASQLATAIEPRDAQGTGIGRSLWQVDAVTTTAAPAGTVDLLDPAGGDGPVQLDGQFVGAVLQTVTGARVAITASQRVSDARTRLTLASVAGCAAGDLVQLRASAAGALLVTLDDPATPYGRVEAPHVRSDLAALTNYLPNSRGRAAASDTAPPTGYVAAGSVQRLAGPLGCPIGDDVPVWRITGYPTSGSGNTEVWRTPATPALDAVVGDDRASAFVVLYVDAELAASVSYTTTINGTDQSPGQVDATFVGYSAYLQVELWRQAPATGVWSLSAQSDKIWTGQQWLVWGVQGAALSETARYRLVLRWLPGAATAEGYTVQGQPVVQHDVRAVPVVVAGQLVARAAAQPDWVEHSTVNLLHQSGQLELLQRRAPQATLAATLIDRARLHPAEYGDQAILRGTDVRLLAQDVGIDGVARVQRPVRDRLVPGDTQVDLAPPVDPALSARGRALPRTPATLTQQVAGAAAAPAPGGLALGPGALLAVDPNTDTVTIRGRLQVAHGIGAWGTAPPTARRTITGPRPPAGSVEAQLLAHLVATDGVVDGTS